MRPERPDVPAGTVVRLNASDWRYGTAERGPLILRVECVRWDLVGRTAPDDHVWVGGQQLRPSDEAPCGHIEVSVRIDALLRPGRSP